LTRTPLGTLNSRGAAHLYTLDWVPAGPRALYRHRDIRGFGDFSDLRQLTLSEVAR
jgi:hypothetical protein